MTRPKTPKLTYQRAKHQFNYDPITGIVTWTANATYINGRPVGRAGQRVGASYNGYSSVGCDGEDIRVHRLIFLLMNGKWPTEFIDHINGDPSDNRWANLREVTNSQNGMNKVVQSNNRSGCPGVCWHKGEQRWKAGITLNGKNIHLGTFKDKDDAIAARKAAEPLYHGEYAKNARPLS